MLCREIIAVCSQIHTKHTNTLCGQNTELYINTQSLALSKRSVSVRKTSQLMLYTEIIVVCSQIHSEHKHTVWAAGFFKCYLIFGGSLTYRLALDG
jgi:hypothetical protein